VVYTVPERRLIETSRILCAQTFCLISSLWGRGRWTGNYTLLSLSEKCCLNLYLIYLLPQKNFVQPLTSAEQIIDSSVYFSFLRILRIVNLSNLILKEVHVVLKGNAIISLFKGSSIILVVFMATRTKLCC
jgi:hypothetical protein